MQSEQWDPFAELKALLDQDSWKTVEAKVPDGIRFSYLLTERQTCCVRQEFDVAVPFWYRASVWRPDFLHRHCGEGTSLLPDMANIEMVREISPGHSVLRLTFNTRDMNSAIQVTGLGGSTSGDADGYLVRSILRRNFPQAGQICKVMLPEASAPRTGRGLGHFDALYEVSEAAHGAEADTTHCMVIFEVPWPDFPEWAVQHLKSFVAMQQRWATKHAALPLQSIASNYFATVALKSCSRGLPLVPCNGGESQHSIQVGRYRWAAHSGSDFSLPAYLNTLFALGELKCRAYEFMDGQKLVPYQALVIREEWEAVQEHLKDIVGSQQTAYRRLNGGTSAPKLRLAKETHFVDEFFQYQPSSVHGPCWHVKNTFVEVPRERWELGALPGRAVECP